MFPPTHIGKRQRLRYRRSLLRRGPAFVDPGCLSPFRGTVRSDHGGQAVLVRARRGREPQRRRTVLLSHRDRIARSVLPGRSTVSPPGLRSDPLGCGGHRSFRVSGYAGMTLTRDAYPRMVVWSEQRASRGEDCDAPPFREEDSLGLMGLPLVPREYDGLGITSEALSAARARHPDRPRSGPCSGPRCSEHTLFGCPSSGHGAGPLGKGGTGLSSFAVATAGRWTPQRVERCRKPRESHQVVTAKVTTPTRGEPLDRCRSDEQSRGRGLGDQPRSTVRLRQPQVPLGAALTTRRWASRGRFALLLVLAATARRIVRSVLLPSCHCRSGQPPNGDVVTPRRQRPLHSAQGCRRT